MIPKIIHHVWPGCDPFKEKFHNFRLSWMRYHPDWTFYFWRLDNLPQNIDLEIKEALLDNNYAITPKSDLLRFEIVRIYGGVYVDTDMECLKVFDDFMGYDFFTGYEDNESIICPSLFGSIPNHPILEEICKTSIRNAKISGYKKTNAKPHKITSVKPFTEIVSRHLDDPTIKVFLKDYFYPVYYNERYRLNDNYLNSYAKHHWSGMESDGWTNIQKFI